MPENSKAGSKVFQVEAHDPDDPNSAEGKIVYSLPDDGTIIRKLFQIDPETGILSTKIKLDREERQNYTLILDISDLGSPPQQRSTIMNVIVTGMGFLNVNLSNNLFVTSKNETTNSPI